MTWLVTLQMSLVEQELATLPGHLNSHPVAQSLVFCVDHCSFSLGHGMVCPLF